MNRPELNPFFLLYRKEPDNCVADLDPDAPYESQRIFCRTFPGHQRGRRLSPLDVIVPCASPPDVFYTWMSECIIQERTRRIFEEEHLTGFTTRPANAKIQGTRASIAVSELLVTGWAGMAPSASGVREVERCRECGYLRYSEIEEPPRLIDPKNWDGSDFFMVWPLPRYRFVTERVVEVCKKHRISGVEFLRTFPSPRERVSPGYSPGRLSYYMPPERAHLLGDRYDIS